ncbi:unnamed protein product [Owenia fusiformis]|uniref:Uncharacterized protein n=1 Tax=Owenia fusiformis TaxID=6347 RepID=A0A8J1XZC7_OWEFU|nr:unnamed protein product [Owenia fusiformis]
MADKITSTASSPNTSALYYDVSPNIVTFYRLFGGVTLIMVLLAFVFCLVKGSENHTNYLLACNLIISTFVGVVISWWYRGGDLTSDKWWFLILVCAVIIFQCLTTDIYAFHARVVPPTGISTPPPFQNRTIPARNITSAFNITTPHKMENFLYDITESPIPGR